MIAVAPPVPDNIQPAEVDLAVTAILLRAGITAEPVPSYDRPTLDAALARVARTLTYRPLRRPA